MSSLVLQCEYLQHIFWYKGQQNFSHKAQQIFPYKVQQNFWSTCCHSYRGRLATQAAWADPRLQGWVVGWVAVWDGQARQG
jgi:hypothetical protein